MMGEVVRTPNRYWMATFKCDECGVLSIGITIRDLARDAIKSYMGGAGTVLTWLPETATGKQFPDVPGHIADAATEATRCHGIGAYRAAVLMARSVVEATAKDQGITSGFLESKIDKLHEKGLVRELVKDQAHEVRHFGNDMAHGDFVDPVDEVDSEEIIALMSELLHEVYQAPAKLQARKAARLAKKSGVGTP